MTENGSMQICHSLPGDAGYVAYMNGRYYWKYHGFRVGAEYYFIKYLADFVRDPNGGRLWVAEADGKIVGSVAVVPVGNNEVQLRWFFVEKECQNKGIGSGLMNIALEFCRDEDLRNVFLWTFKGLGSARHLYEKLGFKETEEKINTEWSDSEIIEQKLELKL